MSYHKPVLLLEAIEALQIQADGIYVDATYGGGGHARAILERLGKNGKLIAFDCDEEAAQNVIEDERLFFINQNYRHLKRYLKVLQACPVHGILADLGVSSHQFDTPSRGFSFRFDSALDMRMTKGIGQTAKEIINSYSETQLQRLFSEYGEITNAKTLSRTIVHARRRRPITTAGDLLRAVEPVVRGKKSKYLAKVFQALRMEVNEEMSSLCDFLSQTKEALLSGGRLVIITYHSIEDRLVKNFMKTGSPDGIVQKDVFGREERIFRLITKKPLRPSRDEIVRNPRARSAKMRVAEKR